MIVTGFAPDPQSLHERSDLASSELVLLARQALREYHATHLITSLAPGWEQALAKAAIEMDIPFSTAIPFPGRDAAWNRDVRFQYLSLLSFSKEVYQLADCNSRTALLDGNIWRIDRSEQVIVLWEYDFGGDVYDSIRYSISKGHPVANLWEDWQHLYSLRKHTRPYVVVSRQSGGARVFESNRSEKASQAGFPVKN